MLNSTPSRMLRTMAHGAAILTAAMLGTAAVAQSSIDVSGRASSGSVTRSQAVLFGDLNLADARGMNQFDQRLRQTISYVCNESAMYGPRASRDYRRCYSDALSGAHAMVAQRVAAGETGSIRVAAR